MPQTFLKDPDARLPYVWDWSGWLGDDAIQTATVSSPDGLTVDGVQVTAQAVTAWLSGGVDGSSYGVTCRVATTGGLQDDRTIMVTVRER
jgi:hypothetical protein